MAGKKYGLTPYTQAGAGSGKSDNSGQGVVKKGGVLKPVPTKPLPKSGPTSPAGKKSGVSAFGTEASRLAASNAAKAGRAQAGAMLARGRAKATAVVQGRKAKR